MLCFDGDAAGARAAARSAELALPLLAPERSLKLATLTGRRGPGHAGEKGGAAAFQPVLDAARPLPVALYDLVPRASRARRRNSAPRCGARLEEVARLIPDRTLAGEYRRALLDRFFEAGRRRCRPAGAGRPGGGGAGRAWRASRRWASPGCTPAIDQPASGWTARNLLAILLRHPLLLPEVEER